MARISTYVTDQNIVADDKWIGSDSQNNFQTKNFTAGDVAEFINTTASESQLFRYKYSNVSPGGAIIRPDESITFTNGGALTVPFSGISQFVLSQYALNQGGLSINVSTWYTNPLLSSDVLITQCDDITQWAIDYVYYYDQLLIQNCEDKVAGSEIESRIKQVLSFIRSQGEIGISKRDIDRREIFRSMKSYEVKEIIERLKNSGEIQEKDVKTKTTGRPTKRIVAIDPEFFED
jgi:hypothetical protein